MLIPLFVLLTLLSLTIAATTPPAVSISSIAYSGSGCPANSIGQFISANGEIFTLIFDDMQAAVGPGVPASKAITFCDITINFAYTSGWQFGTANTTWRGYAGLDKGVKGTSSVEYILSNNAGSTSSGTTEINFTGPYSQEYEETGFVGLQVSNTCKTILPLKMVVQVAVQSSSSTATGLLTNDSLDGNVTSIATGLKWTQC